MWERRGDGASRALTRFRRGKVKPETKKMMATRRYLIVYCALSTPPVRATFGNAAAMPWRKNPKETGLSTDLRKGEFVEGKVLGAYDYETDPEDEPLIEQEMEDSL